MNKQIEKKEISYIHNGNVTVCMVKLYLYYDFWGEIVDACLISRFHVENPDSTILFKGISKCQDGDVYDEKLGEKIAREKAFKKMNNKIQKMLLALTNYYRDKAHDFSSLLSKYAND